MPAKSQILNCAFTVGLDDMSALVLQEEPLRLVVKCQFVDVMHLLSLDQGDNVQISSQFALALLEQLCSFLCSLETL